MTLAGLVINHAGRVFARISSRLNSCSTPVCVWEGPLKREQWNLFSLKVLTRLAQADDLQIDVKVAANSKKRRPWNN
jgi:hypothetical protein